MKVLIVGASGMIGHRMWATLGQLHETIGVLRRSNIHCLDRATGIDTRNVLFDVDAQDISKIRKIIGEVKPDIVLNCVGIVKQLKDSANHIKSISINALYPHQLARICADYNARMIQFSSDCVFDGARGNYSEEDVTNATDIYGRTKALGEINYLQHVLTIRTSSIGREIFYHGGLVEWFLSNQNKKIVGYKNAIYSGFSTKRLAHILSDFIFPRPDLYGVLHVSGHPIDKFTLLQMIKDHFKLNIEISIDEEVRINRSLSYQNFKTLTGFEPIAWEQMISDLDVDFEMYNQMRIKNV